VPSTTRILIASSAAPLALVVPILLLGGFTWSHLTSGPLARPELNSVTPFTFAVAAVIPVYVGLATGFLLTALLLQAAQRLTRRSLLLVSAAVSLGAGAYLACDWQSSCQLSQAAPDAAVHFGTIFIGLAVVSVVWWLVACSGTRANVGPAPRQ
jgi:hypothetical protein